MSEESSHPESVNWQEHARHPETDNIRKASDRRKASSGWNVTGTRKVYSTGNTVFGTTK